MQRWRKRIATVGLTVALFICAILPVAAEETEKPAGTSLLEGTAIPVPGFSGLALTAGINAKEALPFDRMPPALLGQYDLTRDTGKSLRYARVLIVQEAKDLGLIADTFEFLGRSPQVVGMLAPLAQNAITQGLEGNGGKVIEMLPATQVNIGKKAAISLAARVIASDKLPVPLYLQGFIFTQERKLTGVVYLCPDGDREFWQPLLLKAVQDMR